MEKSVMAGKFVLVTGATGYLGAAMSQALAEAGAHVLVNSRSPARAESAAKELVRLGFLASPAPFDVTISESIQEFLKRNPLDSITAVINNAYAGGAGSIADTEVEAYRASYDVTVVAAHNLINCCLPLLRNSVAKYGDASVLNIASMYGVVSPDRRIYEPPSSANPPYYGAAKAGLIQWSRYAACEFGREGIRINSLSPGPFPSLEVAQENPHFIKRLAERVPLGRVGCAHEIAGPVVFLTSPAASFINGANIPVDGGWTSW